MKLRYKIIMFLMLLIFCVGSVCAVEPDNSITINNVSVINGSSDLTDTVNNTDLDRSVNVYVESDINSSDNGLNDSDMTNQDLLIEMFQGK